VTNAAWVALAVGAVLAAGDWLAVARRTKALEYVCKPLTMVAFMVTALALDPVDGSERAWFVAAFALSLAGDAFLMLPERPIGPLDTFVAGLASFLFGHVAFIAGLWSRGVGGPRLAVGVALVLALMLTLGRRIVAGVRAGPDSSLVIAVTAYMLVISVMVASAIGTGVALAIAGSLLFYCSDALIAWNRFIEERPWGRLAIIVTYHAAQAGLLLSLVR
jgi:alkenylglycerophosphocholine/alkenylglycerophosphoethanolamine hydrolase